MKHIPIIILCFLMAASIQAQRITHIYNNVSLSDALRELSRQTRDYTIYFLYDELEDFRITTTVTRKNPPEAIRQMIGFYPVSMTIDTSNPKEHKIFIECTHKTGRNLTGTIIDEHGHPVAFANIALLSPNDSTLLSGGVSNESGYFAIPYETDCVLARISYVGYKTIFRLCNNSGMGTIRLQPEAYTINGVTVEGHAPQFQMKGEGLTMNVENTLLSLLGTAADVLKHVPGVVKKKDQYEVFGKGTPIIYINRRLMRDVRELEQLKSSDIKSVELITNPGAKYDATARAIIKIQTVRKTGDGFSIDARGQYEQGHKDRETLSLDINYRHNGLDIFSSLWAEMRGRFMQIADIVEEIYADTLWKQTNNMRTNITEHYYSINGGFNYSLSEHNAFGAKYEVYLPTDNSSNTTFISNVTADNQFFDNWTNQIRQKTKGKAQHKLNTYYVGEVGELGIDWNFDYLHNGYDERGKIIETALTQEDRMLDTENKVRNRMLATKLTMTYPLFGGSLNFGAEYTNTKRQDNYINPQNYVRSTYSTLKEQNISPYAEYAHSFSFGQLRAGFRYEHVKFDYFDNGIHVKNQSRNYSNLYPSISFGTHFGNVQAEIAYSAKTNRPTYRQLSNDIFYANRYTMQQGNPLLDNSIIHNISIRGMWKFLQFTLSYSDERKPIIYWMTQIGNSNVTLVTYKNINSLKYISPFVTLTPRFGIWHPQLSLGLRKQ